MKIHFLGTGTSQGIPVIGSCDHVSLSKMNKDKRLRSSILIENLDKFLLIDCGPDFRIQMLRSGCSNLDYILLTHEHSDHILGLDDVRPILFNRTNKLYIYSLYRVIEEIKIKFSYFFFKKTSLFNNIKFITLNPNISVNIQGFNEIIPIDVLHGKLPILGYRIKNLAYITDASHLSTNSLKLLKNLDVLIINTLRISPPHHKHFILEETLNIISILKPNTTYLTHVSHMLGTHYKINNILPNNIYLAYDGLVIHV